MKAVEISKGVFRDPRLVVVRASNGEPKRYTEEDAYK